jgi:hypothetical protein
MSNDTDLQTDEDIVQGATREELLTTGALGKGRTFRDMTLRPPTMESMSYLWEMKNYFVFRDEQGRIVRNKDEYRKVQLRLGVPDNLTGIDYGYDSIEVCKLLKAQSLQ